jgi:hypothetical protein
VVHLDSSKSFVQAAMRNVELSNFSNRPVRWIIEDCLSFFEREVRRRKSRKIEGSVFILLYYCAAGTELKYKQTQVMKK